MSDARYAAYAQAHGRTPDAMLEHDCAAWPGGCMCGFLVWMSRQTQAFRKVRPDAFFDKHRIGDMAAWTAFLQSVANAHALAEERSDDSQQRVVGGKVDR
jgi:hypothetical protein